MSLLYSGIDTYIGESTNYKVGRGEEGKLSEWVARYSLRRV
jgi:hypothetical protein